MDGICLFRHMVDCNRNYNDAGTRKRLNRRKKMKVEELIKQLKQTKGNNEVRIISEDRYSKHLYLSFDDAGDVLIFEVKE